MATMALSSLKYADAVDSEYKSSRKGAVRVDSGVGVDAANVKPERNPQTLTHVKPEIVDLDEGDDMDLPTARADLTTSQWIQTLDPINLDTDDGDTATASNGNTENHDYIAEADDAFLRARSPLEAFVERVSLYDAVDDNETGDEKEEQKRVTISTLHAAKGLEWPVVCIYGVDNRNFPHSLSTTPEGIMEERRLLYVGATRAKCMLYLTYNGEESPYSNGPRPDVSPFLQPVAGNGSKIVTWGKAPRITREAMQTFADMLGRKLGPLLANKRSRSSIENDPILGDKTWTLHTGKKQRHDPYLEESDMPRDKNFFLKDTADHEYRGFIKASSAKLWENFHSGAIPSSRQRWKRPAFSAPRRPALEQKATASAEPEIIDID